MRQARKATAAAALWAFLGAAPAFGDSVPFRYADLEQLIRSSHITTIDELLPKLPEDYRKGYTLIYASKSAQADRVSPQWPRIVLFGRDATLLMALTKNPATPPVSAAPDTLETMEFVPEAQAFRLRRLTFIPGQDPLATPPAVNPAECRACHGEDPRPNWDSYNIWPGVFGSLSRLDCDTMQAGTEELAGYQAFLAHRHQDRYQYLPQEVADQGAGRCPMNPTGEFTFRNALHSDPNAMLSQLLTELNFQRLERLIKSARAYDRFQFVWEALGRRCIQEEDLDTYFPDGWAAAHGFKSFAASLIEVEDEARADFAARLTRFNEQNRPSATEPLRTPVNFLDPLDPRGGQIYERQRYSVAALKVLSERMGLDMVKDRWSLAFVDGRYFFTTPYGEPGDVMAPWESSSGSGAVSCDDLKARSLAKLGEP